MTEQLSDQEIVRADSESLYLGNLNTVEFDLNFPSKGKYGSTIVWASKDERWIDKTGKVHRPEYGKGNRTVSVTATFSYRQVSVQKVYEITILEEKNNIQVEKIFPIVLEETIQHTFHLPAAVAVRTKNGEVISHFVTWEGGDERNYSEPGQVTVRGKLKDTDYAFSAVVRLKEKINRYAPHVPQLQTFPPGDVVLSKGSLFRQAQDRRLAFLLTVDDDQMLYNFRTAAGLDTKGAAKMIGWDSPDSLLRGHTTGHYLSALALCYGVTKNTMISAKLNYLITELAKVQQAFAANGNYHSGFLSAYSEQQFDLLEHLAPYPQIWAPYYTLHKIFAGLLDSYRIAGIDLALTIADKLGDWVYRRLSGLPHDQLTKMWGSYIAGEFGGINESLAELYHYTKKAEHIKAAKLFDNDHLFFPMRQHVDALGGLHANQHIPQVIGALRIFQETGEKKYYEIAAFFWQSVVGAHIYTIGGTGEGEMFRQPYKIGSYLSDNTAETCASYNMLKLTKQLYLFNNNVGYMDFYERAMFNHILSTTDHECLGASTYFMPTRPGGQKSFDEENSCCHGTGLENHFKYPEALYFSDADTLYVNLFVPSQLNDKKAGIHLNQSVANPFSGRIDLHIQQLSKSFLKVRRPYWHTGLAAVFINGKPVHVSIEKDYLTIHKQWAAGDTVTVQLTPTLRLEATPDRPHIAALAYGPYILAALANQETFLELPLNPDNLSEKFSRIPGTNHFLYQDKTIDFVPLAEINRRHYHLYFKIK